MSVVKQEPVESAASTYPEIAVNNIKREVKQEKDTQEPVQPGEHLCTCNRAVKNVEEGKVENKFNARKFHRIYVEWNPYDIDIPEDRNGLVKYFSYWGPVQHCWIETRKGVACVEYRGSQSVTEVQLARPHGQTITRRCHPVYHPAVRNVLFLAQDVPAEDSPNLLQHLGHFGEVIHFAPHFIRERKLHLIFVTFQDYDSVDFLMLKLYLRMGSWKFYVHAVKGIVILGADGFPTRYIEPGSARLEHFAKLIPETLPPVVTAVPQATAAPQKVTAAPQKATAAQSNSTVTVTSSKNNPPSSITICSNDAEIGSKDNRAPTPVPGCSSSRIIYVDDEIQILEIPKVPPDLIDLTEEENQSNGDQADLQMEFVSAAHKDAGAEEDDITFLGEVVRHCRKCGGKIPVITLD